MTNISVSIIHRRRKLTANSWRWQPKWTIISKTEKHMFAFVGDQLMLCSVHEDDCVYVYVCAGQQFVIYLYLICTYFLVGIFHSFEQIDKFEIINEAIFGLFFFWFLFIPTLYTRCSWFMWSYIYLDMQNRNNRSVSFFIFVVIFFHFKFFFPFCFRIK